jgi:hypothetical protein
MFLFFFSQLSQRGDGNDGREVAVVNSGVNQSALSNSKVLRNLGFLVFVNPGKGLYWVRFVKGRISDIVVVSGGDMFIRSWIFLMLAVVLSCQSDNGCVTGDQDCQCYKNNTCNGGLVCTEGICRSPINAGADSAVSVSSTGDSAVPSSNTDSSVLIPSRESCDQCIQNQVCIDNKCVDLPDQCPCPVESYCDLATNTCVVGCTADEQCDVGRICIVEARICREGCRNDTDCSTGHICENTTCRPGCRDDSDCTAGSICENLSCRSGCRQDSDCGQGTICDNTVCREGCRSNEMCPGGRVCRDTYCIEGCRTSAECATAGAECVDALCICPQALVPCDGVCVDTNSNSLHCGTCGVTCAQTNNMECRAGSCECIGGLSKCDGVCMDTQSDVHHCGSCTTDCGDGTDTTCSNGECINGSQPSSGWWSHCSSDEDCPEGGVCDFNVCIELCTDIFFPCAPSPGGRAFSACRNGYCVLSCFESETETVPACPTAMFCEEVSPLPFPIGIGTVCTGAFI